jgi:hypothetical protein
MTGCILGDWNERKVNRYTAASGRGGGSKVPTGIMHATIFTSRRRDSEDYALCSSTKTFRPVSIQHRAGKHHIQTMCLSEINFKNDHPGTENVIVTQHLPISLVFLSIGSEIANANRRLNSASILFS